MCSHLVIEGGRSSGIKEGVTVRVSDCNSGSRHNIGEALALYSAKSMAASHQADHVGGRESLPLEGRGVFSKRLLWLWYTRIVWRKSVNTSALEVDLRAATTS